MDQVPNSCPEKDHEEETKLQKLKKIIGKPRPSEKRDEANNNLIEVRGD